MIEQSIEFYVRRNGSLDGAKKANQVRVFSILERMQKRLSRCRTEVRNRERQEIAPSVRSSRVRTIIIEKGYVTQQLRGNKVLRYVERMRGHEKDEVRRLRGSMFQ